MTLLKDMFIRKGDFEVKIGKDLLWVPYCSVGELTCADKKDTVLDALIYFIEANFRESIDTMKLYKEGLEWEFHRKGGELIKNGCGCCSSVASWVCSTLKETYKEVGIIMIVRPTGSGHAINYVKQNGNYYIFDFLTFLAKYPKTLKETGKKSDFFKAKFITNCCMKTNNLNNFSRFYGRIMRIAGYEQLFFQVREEAVPPLAIKREMNHFCIYFPKDKLITPLVGSLQKQMYYQKLDISFEENKISRSYFF
ncbi:hypothetical protein OfM1_13340 [Lactovum odontotermitis]